MTGIPNAAVLAEWSLDDDDVAGVEDDVDAAFAGGTCSPMAASSTRPSAWGLRHRVSESLRMLGVVLGHDVSVPRSALMAVRRRAIDAVAALAPDAVMCDFGHAGDGGLHLNVLFPTSVRPAERRAADRRSADAIDDLVVAAGGSYSAEHGLGPLNAERWLATTPPVEQRLVAALKDDRRPTPHPRPSRPPLQPPLTLVPLECLLHWSVCRGACRRVALRQQQTLRSPTSTTRES